MIDHFQDLLARQSSTFLIPFFMYSFSLAFSIVQILITVRTTSPVAKMWEASSQTGTKFFRRRSAGVEFSGNFRCSWMIWRKSSRMSARMPSPQRCLMSIKRITKEGLDPLLNLTFYFFSISWIGLSLDRALRQLLRSVMKVLWMLLLLSSLALVLLPGWVTSVFSDSS